MRSYTIIISLFLAATFGIFLFLGSSAQFVSSASLVDYPCPISAAVGNVRARPNVNYDISDRMAVGEYFIAVERTDNGEWIFGLGPRTNGWVQSNTLSCPYDTSQLRISSVDEVSQIEPCTVNTSPVLVSSFTPAEPQDDSLNLVAPLDEVMSGKKKFLWSTDVILEGNQAFELIFWPEGGDPLQDGFSPIGAKTNKSVTVNLDEASDNLDQFNSGRDYYWGILLVEMSPYYRIDYLGGEHRFRFEYTRAPEKQVYNTPKPKIVTPIAAEPITETPISGFVPASTDTPVPQPQAVTMTFTPVSGSILTETPIAPEPPAATNTPLSIVQITDTPLPGEPPLAVATDTPVAAVSATPTPEQQ